MTGFIDEFLPFFDERQGCKIKVLVVHCSASDANGMIEVLRERKLSSHYIIDEDGKIFRTVSEKKRAWHAGESHWRNLDNLNYSSIGIELSSPSMGQVEYHEKQLNSLVTLAKQIISHYQIPACNVVGHSDIAPTRKPDPGLYFPWQYMATKGIGLWYDIADAEKISEKNVERLLQIIGYDTANLSAAAYAFCRHFVPSEVAPVEDIHKLVENVYPADFVLPEKCLPVLKACAYKYGKFSNHNL